MSGKRRVNLVLWPVMILISGGQLFWRLTGHRLANDAPWIPYLYAIMFALAIAGFVSVIKDKGES